MGTTVHGPSLHFIPARVLVDLELKVLLRVCDLFDLIFVVDEVSVSVRADCFLVFDKAGLPQFLQIRRKDCIRREIFRAPDEHLCFQVVLVIAVCSREIEESSAVREKNRRGN